MINAVRVMIGEREERIIVNVDDNMSNADIAEAVAHEVAKIEMSNDQAICWQVLTYVAPDDQYDYWALSFVAMISKGRSELPIKTNVNCRFWII